MQNRLLTHSTVYRTNNNNNTEGNLGTDVSELHFGLMVSLFGKLHDSISNTININLNGVALLRGGAVALPRGIISLLIGWVTNLTLTGGFNFFSSSIPVEIIDSHGISEAEHLTFNFVDNISEVILDIEITCPGEELLFKNKS